MTRRKDSAEIVKWAAKRGWRHVETNSMGHLVFAKPGCPDTTTGSKLAGKAMLGAQVKLRRAERVGIPANPEQDPAMNIETIERKVGDLAVPALRHRDIEVTIQTVTPAMAADWLEHNDNNPRRLRIPVAQRYAADVAAGAWAFPTSFIGFGPDGDLVNGQHTLWGVVEGDKPIETLVIYNVPDDAIAAMDRGLKRSLADTLHGEGLPKPRDLQSTIRVCWRWERDLLIHNRRMPTDVECLAWLEANPGAVDATVAANPVQRKAKLKKSVIAPVFYRALLIDAEAAGTWLDQLLSGVGLDEGSPTLKLREYGVASQVRKDRQTYDLAVAVKSWNAHVTGARIYHLRWTREGVNREVFPAMVDVDGNAVHFDGHAMTAAEYQNYEDSNRAR